MSKKVDWQIVPNNLELFHTPAQLRQTKGLPNIFFSHSENLSLILALIKFGEICYSHIVNKNTAP